MAESMVGLKRTHRCTELSESNIAKRSEKTSRNSLKKKKKGKKNLTMQRKNWMTPIFSFLSDSSK